MAMGPLKRNKILVGGGQGVYITCEFDGHGAFEQEQESGWEGQDV